MAIVFLLNDEELGIHFNGFWREDKRLLLLEKSTGYGTTTIPSLSKTFFALFM